MPQTKSLELECLCACDEVSKISRAADEVPKICRSFASGLEFERQGATEYRPSSAAAEPEVMPAL